MEEAVHQLSQKKIVIKWNRRETGEDLYIGIA